MTENTVKKSSSAPTVVVACKHPPGILMRVFKNEEYDVPVLGGGTRKEFRSIAIAASAAAIALRDWPSAL